MPKKHHKRCRRCHHRVICPPRSDSAQEKRLYQDEAIHLDGIQEKGFVADPPLLRGFEVREEERIYQVPEEQIYVDGI
jgi:hypothetical protein